jgi:CDP-diacylglycerol--glycerol-3-phosphate 3-phosphatidyltransferase
VEAAKADGRDVLRVIATDSILGRKIAIDADLLALAAAVIIGREITVSALREWMAEIGARSHVSVSWTGKVKTAAQMIAIILLILRGPFFGLPIYSLGMVLLYLAAVLTLWSMFLYLRAAWPSLAAAHHPNHGGR